MGSTSNAGYYSFRAAETGDGRRVVWGIVLDTASEFGAYGKFDQTQADWLNAQLKEIGPGDVALVFAHHPIWGIEDARDRKRLKQALFSTAKVAAYFAGHTHYPQLRVVEADVPCGCEDSTVEGGSCADLKQTCSHHRIWEVIAPSTIEFPQLGRKVSLVTLRGTSLAYLEILSFGLHLEGMQQMHVKRAARGAELDYCEHSPKNCHNGRAKLPKENLVFPRLFFRLPGGPTSDGP